MTIMIAELYDALKEAGASDDKARRAAETMANYDNRLAAIDTRLTLLGWMVGTNIAISLGVLWKVVF
jgi:hypothetical protein